MEVRALRKCLWLLLPEVVACLYGPKPLQPPLDRLLGRVEGDAPWRSWRKTSGERKDPGLFAGLDWAVKVAPNSA